MSWFADFFHPGFVGFVGRTGHTLGFTMREMRNLIRIHFARINRFKLIRGKISHERSSRTLTLERLTVKTPFYARTNSSHVSGRIISHQLLPCCQISDIIIHRSSRPKSDSNLMQQRLLYIVLDGDTRTFGDVAISNVVPQGHRTVEWIE